jgi:RNA polymerase sigma factor (sigma-70 family)
MNKALLSYWRVVFGGRRARRRLSDALERLSLYCQAPEPQAKMATELHEAMKQWTWWPQNDLLKQIKDSVLILASTERKKPEWRPWKAFELVDRRNPGPRLIKRIGELVERARERFTESNFSDLEALSADKDALKLLRDIDRIKENVSDAKAIDWAQHKDILSRFTDDGPLVHIDGNDASLACYARVLELIIAHRKWEKLRKESEALVFWLLEIGYPKATELEVFNHMAAFRWIWEEEQRFRRKREAKWAKLQQSKRIVKKSREDIEDDRLMMLVGQRDAEALAELRKRYEGMVKKIAREITHSNSSTDDILQRTFIQVWEHAHTYVPVAKFSAWVTKIAKNLAINEGKRASSVKERVEFDHVSEAGSKGSQKINKIGDSKDEGADFSSCPVEDSSMVEGEVASEFTYVGEDGRAERDSETDHVLQALSQLSPLEQRIVEARIMAPPSKRKDRQVLARELGITAAEVEDLENELPGKLREIMHL